MNKPYKFSIEMDVNGNQVCRLKIPKERSFTVQTNDNMPRTHRDGVCILTPKEFKDHVLKYGNDRQKRIVNKTL